jgi:hypothetical protein
MAFGDENNSPVYNELQKEQKKAYASWYCCRVAPYEFTFGTNAVFQGTISGINREFLRQKDESQF